MDKKKKKELIKEFQETFCAKCKSYVFCGGEVIPCKEYELFLKEKDN